MLGLSLIFATIILLLTLFELFLPDLWRPDHLFSVTIAPDSRHHPEVHALIRRWRLYNAALGMAAAAASLVTYLLPQSSYLVILPVLLVAYSIGARVLYVVFHRQAQAFALPAEAANATRVASLGPRASYGTLVPYWWEALPLGIIVLTALVLATRYSSAPAVIPIHFNLAGQADGFATKSIASFFALVWMQLGAWILLTVLAVGVSTGRMAPLVGTAAESYRRTRVRFLFATKTGVMIFTSLTAILTTSAYQSNAIAGQVAALAFAVNVVTVGLALVFIVRHGQGGWRTDRTEAETAVQGDATPDRAWLGGLFYFNPDDPAIFVQKRYGFGYTLNLGRPMAWLFVLGPLLIPIILTLTNGH